MDQPTRKQGTKSILESLPERWAWNMHAPCCFPGPPWAVGAPSLAGGDGIRGQAAAFPQAVPTKIPSAAPPNASVTSGQQDLSFWCRGTGYSCQLSNPSCHRSTLTTTLPGQPPLRPQPTTAAYHQGIPYLPNLKTAARLNSKPTARLDSKKKALTDTAELDQTMAQRLPKTQNQTATKLVQRFRLQNPKTKRSFGTRNLEVGRSCVQYG